MASNAAGLFAYPCLLDFFVLRSLMLMLMLMLMLIRRELADIVFMDAGIQTI